MEYFSVNKKMCSGDGKCSKVCPLGIIGFNNGIPEVSKESQGLCQKCGHCVAACPAGAITAPGQNPENCVSLDSKLNISPDSARQFLKSRRSIRCYTTEQPSKRVIEDIITTCSYGASGHNSQPLSFLAVNSPERVKAITAETVNWMKWMDENQKEVADKMFLGTIVHSFERGADLISRKAPSLVLIMAHKDNPYGPSAGGNAAASFELAAKSHGLGSCFAGYIQLAAAHWPPLQELLKTGENNVLSVMLLGYPDVEYYRIPERNTPVLTWMD